MNSEEKECLNQIYRRFLNTHRLVVLFGVITKKEKTVNFRDWPVLNFEMFFSLGGGRKPSTTASCF